MNKKTKIILIIIIALVLIIVGLGIVFFIKKDNSEQNKQNTIEQENVENNEIINEQENIMDENIIEENEIIEENTNININTIVNENTNNETPQEPQIIGREEQESINANHGQTEEEKVLELAKNKWGADDNTVTFNIVNHEKNTYVVSVNNKTTTAVMTWYQVNASTGEITE